MTIFEKAFILFWRGAFWAALGMAAICLFEAIIRG